MRVCPFHQYKNGDVTGGQYPCIDLSIFQKYAIQGDATSVNNKKVDGAALPLLV